MPIFNNSTLTNEQVLLWEITESEHELSDYLRDNTNLIEGIANINNKTRKKQFVASRALIKQAFGDVSIEKTPNGKPLIKDSNQHISMSHDGEFATLIVSNSPCGIDIQSISNKVLRIKHKFIHPDDLYANSNNIDDLTILWCAKEAIYKINGEPEIFFKEHIVIRKGEKDNQLSAEIVHLDYKAEYQLEVARIKNYYLVYTLQ